VQRWQLPSRPTKSTDTRSRSFDGESVELDAIPPEDLRDLVRSVIEGHVDDNVLEATQAAEQSERNILTEIAATARGGAS
jgi:hypothetical protein